jgi:adenosylhomocysteinase
MSTIAKLRETAAGQRQPFKVHDLALAELGRKEIRLAEQEMPGLMVLRQRHGAKKPLAGAKIVGSLHMTVQTAVLIETLADLGADVRWCSCNIFSTQDSAAAAVAVGRKGTAAAPQGANVFAWKGEVARGVLVVHQRGAHLDRWLGPDIIVDDGGDATLLDPRGLEFEKAGRIPDFDAANDPEEWGVILELLRRLAKEEPGRWQRIAAKIRGVSERRQPACTASTRWRGAGTLLFPAINVNDSVTKSKFDNIYGCRHSLVDGLRATDVMLGGKVAVVCGFGEVGKGCAESLRGQGCRVIVTEIDPICALQAAMQGYEVEDHRRRRRDRRHLRHRHRHRIISAAHMARMKSGDRRATSATSTTRSTWPVSPEMKGVERVNIKPQYDEWVFPDGHSVLILRREAGCSTSRLRHRAPSFVMRRLLHQPEAGAAGLWANAGKYEKKVYMLPKQLDEKSRLHLEKLGVTHGSRRNRPSTSACRRTGRSSRRHYRY